MLPILGLAHEPSDFTKAHSTVVREHIARLGISTEDRVSGEVDDGGLILAKATLETLRGEGFIEEDVATVTLLDRLELRACLR